MPSHLSMQTTMPQCELDAALVCSSSTAPFAASLHGVIDSAVCARFLYFSLGFQKAKHLLDHPQLPP